MADDYGNDINTNGVVQIGLPKVGSIETVGDHDWFKIFLLAGQNYLIDLYGSDDGVATLSFPDLAFRNASGSLLSASTTFNGNGNNKELALHVTTSGTYFIDISGDSSSTGTYLITLDHADATRFQETTDTPNLPVFGSSIAAGSWTDQNTFPRMLTQEVTHSDFFTSFNRDYEQDIVGFGENGVFVSLATGNGEFAAPQLKLAAFGHGAAAGGWTSQDQFPREVGDINGDEYTDIVGFGSNGVYYSLNTGGIGGLGPAQFSLAAFGASAAAGSWTSQDHYPRLLADVNNDLRDDIVGFGEGGVLVSLATTTPGQFTTPTLALAQFGAGASAGGSTSQNVYPRLLADVNNDGKADIVAFGENGVFVSLSTGTGFAPSQQVLSAFGHGAAAGGWTSQDQFPRELADVNGDGYFDIVGFGQNGVFVALNNHTGGFSTPTADVSQFGISEGWTSQNTTPRLLGDITGDNKADIVAFGPDGVHTSMSLDYFGV